MDLRPLVFAGLLGPILAAQAPTPPAPAAAQADPFTLPPEAHAFALRATGALSNTPQKLAALLRAIFAPRESGGLGLTYDDGRTRSVAEVWTEGKANCLSLTAFYVAACNSLGIRAEYAEALNTNHWRRVGSIIRFERHVVALTPCPPLSDLVADFVPVIRKRYGTYVVTILTDQRFKALYYSNLAVESLADGDLDAAKVKAQLSLDSDPKSGVGWNVLGVVQFALGDNAKAEEAYRRAMALDPRDGAPIGNMETLLKSMGRPEEALRFRQMGERVRKKDPYFHSYLAEEALAQGDPAEARTRLRAALKILPKEPDFHVLLARVELAEGNMEAALKELQEAKHWSDPAERDRYEGKLAYLEGLKKGKTQ